MTPLYVRRHFVTLIELLVAIALLSGLLVFLLGSYRQLDQVNDELKQLRKESFKLRYAEFRLANTLPSARINGDATREGHDDFYFYTSDEANASLLPGSLVFVFERGVDVQPEFSSVIIARLYVNQQHQLCLAIWPLLSRWEEGKPPPMRKEILLDRVESLNFEFYVPPDPEEKFVQPEAIAVGKDKVDPSPGWRPEWKTNYKGLPSLVKIYLQRYPLKGDKPETTTYAFVLHNSSRTVIYKNQETTR